MREDKKGSEFESLLEQLHVGLAQQLFNRVASGEASSADMSVARQFLKDNGIEWNPTKAGHPMAGLSKLLPEFDKDTAH